MNVKPSVSIIILNWNGFDDTVICLESLKKITYSFYKVVVIDNASSDDEGQRLKEKFGEYIHLIQNQKNLGFAEGNNVGIRYVLKKMKTEYILLLNNDTVVIPDFLEKLVETIQNDSFIGAVQPKMLKQYNHNIIDSLGQEILKFKIRDIRASQHDDVPNDGLPGEIFGVCAGAALYRTQLFEKIGLFNPNFFAIFEDVDLSWRAHLEGFRFFLVASSIVMHNRGISGNGNVRLNLLNVLKIIINKNQGLKFYLQFKNSLMIFIQYFPLKLLLMYFPVYLGIFAIGLCKAMQNRKIKIFLLDLVKAYTTRSSLNRLYSPIKRKMVQRWIQ